MLEFYRQEVLLIVIVEATTLDEVSATEDTDCSGIFPTKQPSARKDLNFSLAS